MKLLKLCCGLVLLMGFSILQAQTTQLKGQVRDGATNEPLEGVQVLVQYTKNGAITDAEGRFVLDELVAGEQVLEFRLENYKTLEQSIVVRKGEDIDLGTIVLTATADADDDLVTKEELIPTVTLSDSDLVEQENMSSNISSLLTASRDVFVNAAAFNFSATRFRIRGYDSENTTVLLNGVPMNDLENGRVFWSLWGGLNDVMRNREIDIGLASPIAYSFGGAGGATNIDTRASRQWKQTRVSYSLANRSYNNRVMLTHSTGMLPSGWAFSFSGSHRWAQEGYQPGTFYDGYSYFMSIDKELGDKHLLNFVAFGAPTKRGRGGASTQEVYDLAGTNYYNPNWGFQNGEKRNSRVANIHQPVLMLRHDWEMNDKITLTTSSSYQFGFNGSTALDWYDARDPRPDFYRRLPSAIEDPEAAMRVAERLSANPELLQVDWANMYSVNRKSFATIEDVDGIEGNDVSGLRAKYIVEDRHFDSKEFNFNSIVQAEVNENLTINGGLLYQIYQGDYYKEVEDLLGADFYVDIDRFVERDIPNDPNALQNDLNRPNRLLQEGDRFGYDYDPQIRRGEAWGQAAFTYRSFDFYMAANVSNTTFWRRGDMKNGRFPESSFGDSEKQDFFNYGAKGGLTYKVNGRNYLYASGIYQTRAPFVRNAYVSPRTRDQVAPGLSSELIYGGEVGYNLRSPFVKARATFFYTQFENGNRNISFYNDAQQSFVNFTLTDIDKEHMGLELAIEGKVTPTLTLNGVAALGQYIFNSRQRATITQDNNAAVLVQDRTIFSNNFYVPGTPQTAYSAGINYSSPNYWFANLNFNFFDDLWIDFNPDRRTEVAVEGVDDAELRQDILFQEQAPSGYTLNFFGGKSFKFGDYFLYLTVGVSNLLDNQDLISGGYEQLRFDYEEKNLDLFPNRYFYSFGRNYFVNLSFRF